MKETKTQEEALIFFFFFSLAECMCRCQYKLGLPLYNETGWLETQKKCFGGNFFNYNHWIFCVMCH